MVARTTVLPDGVAHTYDQLIELFGRETDGKRYELFQGALVVSPSPSLRHQEVLMNLVELLRGAAKGAGGVLVCAPFDVVLADDDVLIPDLLYVSPANVGRISDRRMDGAPDLVIEILSPSTATRDRGVKRSSYAAHGVREYWVVDPAQARVEIYSETDLRLIAELSTRDSLETPLLPGLAVSVADIFE